MTRVVSDGLPEPWSMSARSLAADTVVVVWLRGDWDLSTTTTATLEFLASVTTVSTEHLILDMSGVVFMASRAVSCLLTIQSGQLGITGSLHLSGVGGNRAVQRVLALTGLLDVFDVWADLDRLLAELGAGPESPSPAPTSS